MIVDPLFLALSLLLLLCPRNWLRHGRIARVRGPRAENQGVGPAGRDPHEQRTLKPLEEAMKPRNWIDFVRAAAGAYALTKVALVPAGEGREWFWASAGAVLFVSVLVQMLRWEGRLGLFAPVFFLQGLCFGVAGGLVGILTMAGSWGLSPVLPGPGAFIFVQGAIALSLGLVFERADPPLLFVLSGVIWLPMVTSVLLHKRLSASFDKRVKVVTRESRTRERAGARSLGSSGED